MVVNGLLNPEAVLHELLISLSERLFCDCVGICDEHFVHSTLSASIRLVALNFYIQSLPLAL